MKNFEQKATFSLCAESIDIIADRIETICKENKLDHKSEIRIRLSVEESLAIWLNQFGEGRTVLLEFGRRLLRPYFQISVEGEAVNPYDIHSDDFGIGGKSLLVNFGLIPVYSYSNGQNSLTFSIKKENKNQILSLFIVILSAFAAGILGKLLIPGNIIEILSEQIITPINDAFFSVLKATAGPMIFLSVAWGIYGIGDVYTLGKIGKKLMMSFMLVVFAFSFLGAFFFPLFSKALASGSTQIKQFGKIFEMILGIFPDNIFSPFIDGNTLQIIFLAFIIGLSMIFLGQRTSSVARAVEQINHIINFLMSFISKLVPYFVFIVLVQIIWSDNFETLLTVWKFAAIFFLAYIVLIILHLLYVSVKNKVNPFWLLKSCLPSYMIALSTASSAATFESNITICRKKLGIDNSMTSFGIPFGMVMFKPNTALYYLLLCFYLSSVYNVNVTLSWLIIAVIITAVCAVATPPIPGGSAATYTMLFLQLGIPAEALAIALAVDLVFDFFLTSGDMICLLFEMFSVSSKLNLRKNKG